MDFWTVIAAAGARYIAKHWQNPLRDRGSSAHLPSEDSNFMKPESPHLIRSKSFPIHRLAENKKLGEDALIGSDWVARGASTVEETSTCEFDGANLANVGNSEDCNALSVSSLVPNEDLMGDWERIKISGDMGESSVDSLLQTSDWKIRTSYGFPKNRSSLRNRRFNMQSIRPLSSLENCLIAQLYKEHAEMEERMLSSVPSPSTPIVRPFFVTDGSRIISRAMGDSFSMQIDLGQNQLESGTYSAENDTVFGVPPLPKVESSEFSRKTKVKTGKEQCGKLSSSNNMVNGKQLYSQAGSSHGVLLFCLGILVGIISSVLENKQEVDKLNGLLKQTESLVQDLQDELEMKDSLTVKELAIDDYEPQDTHNCSYKNRIPYSFSSEQNLGESTKCDVKELHDQNAQEYLESMSKIEAELEAELERLELNMNSTSLEGKLSDLVELDPDYVPDIVQAELRVDMFGRQSGAQPYADLDGSSTSTTHSANYAVSPRELSLRLHEVIQSRLEERVKELETALQNSHMKVQFMESENINSWQEFSNCKVRSSSSIQGSPISEGERSHMDQPMVINLSGKALDAYNEAYDEFTKMNESEEENLRGDEDNREEDSYPFDGNSEWHQNGMVDHDLRRHTIMNARASMAFIPGKGRTLEEHTPSEDVGISGDENDSGHDELEKLLIKQIVEKTRQGSPVVLNAQRVLYSMDENEH